MQEMEALKVSKDLKTSPPCNFDQFLRDVELNCRRNEAIRQQEILVRRKNKENWMVKSKILPPCLGPPSQQIVNASSNENTVLHLASFYDYRKTTPISQSQPEIRSLSRTQTFKDSKVKECRQECKTSHAILRGGKSCEKLKQNWKLEFRRDELNILRYLRECGEAGESDTGTQKHFRMRRVQKKFEEVRPRFEIYKTNIQNIRENRTPSPKVRSRVTNSRQ